MLQARSKNQNVRKRTLDLFLTNLCQKSAQLLCYGRYLFWTRGGRGMRKYLQQMANRGGRGSRAHLKLPRFRSLEVGAGVLSLVNHN